MTTSTALITRLRTMTLNDESSLKQAVAVNILAHIETDTEAVSFFQDLAQHGCVSGMVSGLIYYTDTHRFFDTHYSEIEELRQTLLDNTGLSLIISGDLKNHLAWIAFEETARQVASDLGIEV